jgi:serine/threonine protein kinase
MASGDLDFLAPPQAPGEMGRLGPYRVLRVLGSGSMGLVFEAEDIHLHRLVALKVMKKDQARKADNRARFLQEARSAAQIEHDHIVTIYQVGEDRDVPFLAMKLLQGESLEERLNREGPLPPEEVVRIGKEIASGLSAAHEKGLIHRDIKPANIWLEEGTGRVKIVDFGLARAYDDEAATEAERNYLIGTPLYMSPEQARGAEAEPRSDLFSLGAVLYRCATGELPFKGSTSREVLVKVLREDPEPVRDVNRDVPPSLARVIMDMLSKAPDDRYRTADIVIGVLEEARKKLHEMPPDEDDFEVVEAEVEGEERKPRKPKRKGLPKKKSKPEVTLEGRVIWWAVFAGICVFLLLGYLVIRRVFFKHSDESAAPPAAAWSQRA